MINQFQLPLLFHLVCVLLYVTAAAIIAWLGALRRASRHDLTANRRHILLHCAVHKAGLSSSQQTGRRCRLHPASI